MLIPTSICPVLVIDVCPECGAVDSLDIDWCDVYGTCEGRVFCEDCGYSVDAGMGSGALIEFPTWERGGVFGKVDTYPEDTRERGERRGLSLFKQVDRA